MKLSFRTNVDVVKIHAGDDGTSDQSCWFCGRSIVIPDERTHTGTGLAMLTIEPMGEGERIHTVCHLECAQHSKGSLRF